MSRNIVHLDLDSFFVSVEQLKNSKLIGKPVLIGGTSDRGVVASCSYEARKFGVSSAMPMRMARILCPDAIIVRGDMEEYSRYSTMVTDIITERAPVVEKASIDEHYLDITGMDKFFGCHLWAHELRQVIMKNTGLPISFGLSVNKTVAKVATGEAKPNGEKYVEPPLVQSFLNPLSIKKIPGVGDKTYRQLRSMGVERIQTLTQISPEQLYRLLGENGVSIWQKANGIDETPVIPYVERKSVSTETTFDKDTTDVAYLYQLLQAMVMELTFQLRRDRRLTSCVTVKLRYSNFDTETKQMRITYTALDKPLVEITRQLFDKLYSRRMLVRLIGVRFSHLVSGFEQIDLFSESIEHYNLYQAMDKIRRRFGEKAITIAGAASPRSHEEREHIMF
ncbi:DNA polymerase IV [Solitalea longa]|uniref:DNA polymerase IV n=1 Tax=Solitalea longa TaxID=2079460 RepID=A0A2S5A6I4_9SPHI|nr:DNA polymerase IV [Solitalea longa]POY37952.1 DNA polymerase IV [Solitalea longa]